MRQKLNNVLRRMVKTATEAPLLRLVIVPALALGVVICEAFETASMALRRLTPRRTMALVLAACMVFAQVPALAFEGNGFLAVNITDSGAPEAPNDGADGTAPSEDNEQGECTCPPVDSGDMIHIGGCPLYGGGVAAECVCAVLCTVDAVSTACPVCGAENADYASLCKGTPAHDALAAVYALIDALPTLDELGAVDAEGEGFAEYLAKLRADVTAARAAYDALTDEERAAFDADALAKLTALEEVLAAMPVLMAADTIPTLDANNSYQNVKYTLDSPVSGQATVSGVVSIDAETGVGNNLTIPAQVQKDGVTYNVTTIGSYAFERRVKIKSVTLPNSVTTIGENAFADCMGLATVSIPSSVTSIGERAFQSCTSLPTVSIPSGVTTIGQYAFYGCTSLATVLIPSSVTTIGSNAFAGMKSGAVVTLGHTGNLPDGITKDSFLSTSSNLNTPFYVVADVAVAQALGDMYENGKRYGMIVSQAPKSTSFENVNNGGTLKARTPLESTIMGGYDVAGVKNSADIRTTYLAKGYTSYLSIGDTPSLIGSARLRLPGAGVESYVKNGIWAKVETKFVSDDQYLRVTYTLRNNTGAAIDNVALGVNADVQIGDDDTASIFPTATGFRMVNTKTDSTIGKGMQFTLNCTNAPGADNVSTMWYGAQGDMNTNLFTDLAKKDSLDDGTTDSALAFSWQGMTIPANGSITRSVVFGVGEAAEPPKLPTDPTQKPIALYLTTQGEKDITVNAKVTDTAGVTDTLYYTINDGAEQTLGETVTADGTEKTIAGVITADNFAADSTYTVKLWIMNSKGAMSEVITKELTVTADGTMGGAGLETGEAPVPPSGGGTVECTCELSVPTFAVGSIKIPQDAANATKTLSASGSVLTGECTKEGHSNADVTYSYAEKTDTDNIASINDNILTVTGVGTVTITATATANGKTATTDAVFTVTKAAAEAKITIKINDGTEVGGENLSDAIYNSGIAVEDIKELTITKGKITTEDWEWFKGAKGKWELPALTHFTVASDVTSVADIPNGTNSSPVFPKTIISVSIPRVLTIGEYAFYGCNKLTSVDLPAATTIGTRAFFGCAALTSVSFQNVTSVGQTAFEGCALLTEASFPNVTSIEESVFNNCGALTSAKYPVATSIGNSAFASCPALTSAKVDLSAAKSIGEYAFNGCATLTEVSFPAATSIGQAAFQNCYKLISVSFPAVKTIGKQAFVFCAELATLTLGTEVPTVAANAFTDCPKTNPLTLVGTDGNPLSESTTPQLSVIAAAYDKVVYPDTGRDTDGKWYGWTVREPVAEAKITIKINGATTEYGGASLEKAFENSGVRDPITELTVTKGEFVAADWAIVTQLVALTDFTVAPDVTKVADIPDASYEVPTFPSTIKTVSIPQVADIGDYAFSSCAALTSASFPVATSIGERAFYNCSELTTASFPAARSIGERAFADCKKLVSTNFPAATSIGQYAFNGCKSLASANLPVATSIGKKAFDDCTKLATLTLGKTVPTVGADAFAGCLRTTLKLVDASGNALMGTDLATAQAKYDEVNDGAAGYATDGKWYGWKVREPVTEVKITIKVNGDTTEHRGASLPAAVTTSGVNVNNIITLNITAGEITTADWEWFKNGSRPKLTDFTVASEVTKVAGIPNGKSPYSVFPETIKNVSIPQAITIGEYAFNGCTTLTSADIPKATSIGKYAFNGCTTLTSASFPKVATIGEYAFSECAELTSATFPEVATIGKDAFMNCGALTNASFPAATSIGAAAFYECTALKSASFPKVATIGKDAFMNCGALTNASFPAATSIGEYAFHDCTKLATLTLGAVPPKPVGMFAFGFCPSTRALKLVAANGAELTGAELTAAQVAYDGFDDGEAGGTATDGKWYGWKLPELVTEAKITIKVNDATAEHSGTSLRAAVTASGVKVDKIITLNITAGEITPADWVWFNGTDETTWGLPELTHFTVAPEVTKVADIPNGKSSFQVFPKKIVDVKIPQAITIGDSAFQNCNKLTSADIPKATSIGDNAFKNCGALTNASFPAATSIGAAAFNDCTKLATLTLGAVPPKPVGMFAFGSCPPTRALKLVAANGAELTGAELTAAQVAYDGFDDGETGGTATDGKWYGWQVRGSSVTVPVTGVSLNKTSLTLAAGKKTTLVATVLPATATNKAVTWKSSAEDIATVDANGEVTAVKVGTASITVTTVEGGKTAFCTVMITATVPGGTAPGGELTAPLTQDKVDEVFGDGNATLDDKTKPSTIHINNDITVEKPIIVPAPVTIDLGGNNVTGGAGANPVIKVDGGASGGSGVITGGGGITGGNGGAGVEVGDGNTVIIGGGTEINGGDSSTGSGGNGITGGGSVIIGGGSTGGGSANGGNGGGSTGNGGSGVDTGGDITIGGGGSASGGNGSGSGNGGDGAGSSGGNIEIGSGGSASGGNGSGTGSGGDGAQTGGSGTIDNGGTATGGTGGSNPGGTGGSGGNGATSDSGAIDNSGTSSGGAGGNGTTAGGAGGNGTTSDSGAIDNGGTSSGGAGGSGTTAGSGSTEIGAGGSASGGTGGNGTATGGNGGNGSASTGSGSITNGGSTTGGTGGSGATGGNGGNGTTTGGSNTVNDGGLSTGGTGGNGSTAGGNGGNGTDTSGTDTTIDGGATGGGGGSGTPGSNGSGGNGGNGANQGSGTIDGTGTATGGNGGSGAGTGNGGTGGSGVGGGATSGSNLKTKDGISAKIEIVGDAGTSVTIPDAGAAADAVMTEDEKKDPDITQVKVTLKVDDKTAAKPDADIIQGATQDPIGAFFDITLKKTVSTNGNAGSAVPVSDTNGKDIEITITIPTNMLGGSDYVVIRVHNGRAMALPTTQSGNELTFGTDKFSTYAIAYKPAATPPPPANNASNGGGGSNGQYDFWMEAKSKIQSAERGDMLAVNAKGYDQMPASVMAALRTENVGMVITWDGGKTITIPAGKAQKPENDRIYYPLSLLAELYAGIEFVETPFVEGNYTNPATGGPGYVEYADGKQTPVNGGVTRLEAPVAPATLGAPIVAAPSAVTPPDSGFEAGAYAGTPDAKRADGRVAAFPVIAIMLAAVAVGSGVWFWGDEQEQKEKETDA